MPFAQRQCLDTSYVLLQSYLQSIKTQFVEHLFGTWLVMAACSQVCPSLEHIGTPILDSFWLRIVLRRIQAVIDYCRLDA